MNKLHNFLFIVFAACISSLSPFSVAASPNDKALVLDSSYTYNENRVLIAKSYFKYDSCGNKTKSEGYLWDNNRYIGTSINLYTYNADGMEITWELQKWNNATNSWKPSKRQESEYDGKNKSQLLEMSWDVTSNSWLYTKKELIQYDSNSNVISSEKYSWNSYTQKWFGSTKFTNTYDEKGIFISSNTFYWDEHTDSWVDEASLPSNCDYDSTYDSNHNLTKKVLRVMDSTTQTWSDSLKWEYTIDYQNKITKTESFIITPDKEWKLVRRDLFDYNEAGKTTLEEKYYYNSLVDSLIGDCKKIWTYDVNGRTTLYIYCMWYEATGTWVPLSKSVKAYTDDGKTTLDEYYQYDNLNAYWIGLIKNEYIYNEQGNITNTLSYEWTNSSNTWQVDYTSQSTFDEEGREIYAETQRWDSNKNRLIYSGKAVKTYFSTGFYEEESFSWNDSDSSWVPLQKNVFTYEENDGYKTIDETFLWSISKNAYYSYRRTENYHSALVTGLKPINNQPTSFEVSTKENSLKIRFASLPIQETVRVFDASGRLIQLVSSTNGFEQYVRINAGGIYLVSDGKTTTKILLK